MAALQLDEKSRLVAAELLLPATYLAVAAKKAKPAQERGRIAALAESLKQQAYTAAPILRTERIAQVILACSHMFQRASSCVEGRNGQLALRHHALHAISDGRLKALTAVHNYAIEDAHGTTAAERFFGKAPTRNLVGYVADRIALPARPAAKRSRREALPGAA